MTDYILNTDIKISPAAQTLANFVISKCHVPSEATVLVSFIRFDKPITDQQAVKIWTQHLLDHYPNLMDYEFGWMKYYVLMCFENAVPFTYCHGIPQDFDFSPLVYAQG